MSLSLSYVVRITIRAEASSRRISSITPTPSSAGIRRSRSVTFGRCFRHWSEAWRPSVELTQIKRHRRGGTERRQKGSLTHGKKTPGIGGNEHEPGTKTRVVAEVEGPLFGAQSGGQEPDVERIV